MGILMEVTIMESRSTSEMDRRDMVVTLRTYFRKVATHPSGSVCSHPWHLIFDGSDICGQYLTSLGITGRAGQFSSFEAFNSFCLSLCRSYANGKMWSRRKGVTTAEITTGVKSDRVVERPRTLVSRVAWSVR